LVVVALAFTSIPSIGLNNPLVPVAEAKSSDSKPKGTYVAYKANSDSIIVATYSQGSALYTVNFNYNKKSLIIYKITKDKRKKVKSISIKSSPLFGGFYQAPDGYFYLLTGQSNPEESTTINAITVRKYTSAWKLKGTTYIPGGAGQMFAGIFVPFAAGNASMILHNGKLVVHMARTMFIHADGLHHQSNFTFEVDTKTMQATVFDEVKAGNNYYTWTFTRADGSWSSYNTSVPSTEPDPSMLGPGDYTDGTWTYSVEMRENGNLGGVYTSHSFNQYTARKGDDLYLVDHGDAYPRSIVMNKITDFFAVDKLPITNSEVDLVKIKGNIGDNYTGVTLGGFEMSTKNALLFGTSVPHYNTVKGSTADSGKQNAFISVYDTETGVNSFKWLTKNSPTGKVNITSPHIIKLNDNRFILLYTTETSSKSKTSYKLGYKLIDGNGKVLATKTFAGKYFDGSDLHPQLIKNNLYLNIETLYTKEEKSQKENSWVYPEVTYSGVLALNIKNPAKPKFA
jgi:hypothetical protein